MKTTTKILPNQLSNASAPSKPGKDSKILSNLPGQDKPLICKLLTDPRSGNGYVQMAYYNYSVGPDPKKHSRSRPSLLSLKKLAADPEKEEFWRIHNEIKELKKTHNENHPAVVALENMKKLYSARECGWFYFVEPNSDVIKCIKLGPDVINQLFGKEATKYKPAYTSLIETAAKNGKNPYDLFKNTGWLKMYKTGEGLSTRYHVSIESTQVEAVDENGETYTKTTTVSHPVHPRLTTEGVDLEEFPNPVEFEARNAFTVDETINFIKSKGTVIPERFLPQVGSDAREVNEGDAESSDQSAHVALASLDDIPF